MESFTDEIAALARVDPLEFRLRRLSNPRGLEVLKRVAARMGWQPRPSPRPVDRRAAVLTGRGLAYVHYKHEETIVAMGMEVAVERATGRIRVTRVVCAQDCGLMINPDCVQAQLEGNILQTLSRALHEEVVYDRDRVTTVDWASYPILTFPGGAQARVRADPAARPAAAGRGGGGLHAGAGAALGNAVFDATGVRLRTVPFRPDRVKAALAGQVMMEVRRLGPQIGAEILGVDVRTLDDAGFARIYRAWLDHNVAVVPGQELELDDFLAYSRRFGQVVPHPSKMTRHPERPEITLLGVNKFGADGALDLAIYRRGAEGWHTDGAYDEEPFKATQLYALAVPSRGGDTHFASMYAAYDALPSRLKERLEGRKGAFTYGGRRKATALLNAEDRDWTPVFHPIIRTHPETGRKGLYFDPGKILYIDGLEPAESDALIDELTERMIQPEGAYTHRWRKGDIVIWDNRCSYHKAAGDYPPEEDRIHWRVSIKERT